MDQSSDKPFKTIEVVDSRTNQVCKVACMSCIRGHRTTSCGIQVCRAKVFWTVKRPGRPSNSCTCRYGATGGCKCVVARSACPHKAKKGEKRSGECRCDEQGRYCCLIEPDHWTALFALQKPTVDFYPTKEDLDAANAHTQHIAPSPGHMMAIPAGMMSMPSTPRPSTRMLPPQIMPSPYDSISPARSSSLTPRFGMMGLGAGQGSQHELPLDVLAWNGTVPPAPRDYQQSYDNNSQVVPTPEIALPHPMSGFTYSQPESQHGSALPQTLDGLQDLNGSHAEVIPTTVATTQPPTFDTQRMQDFYLHRLPSAICQSCGYAGCNCKACPPLFQNPWDGSWGQCCGRKHAREPQTTPEPRKIARSSDYDGSQGIHAHAQSQQGQGAGGGCCGSSSEEQVVNNHETSAFPQPTGGGGACCGSSSIPQVFGDNIGDHGFQPDHAYTNGFEQDLNMIPTDFSHYTMDNDFEMMPVDLNDYLHLDPTQSLDETGVSGGTLGVGSWSQAPNDPGKDPPRRESNGVNLVPPHDTPGEGLPGGTSAGGGGGGCCGCSGGAK